MSYAYAGNITLAGCKLQFLNNIENQFKYKIDKNPQTKMQRYIGILY